MKGWSETSGAPGLRVTSPTPPRPAPAHSPGGGMQCSGAGAGARPWRGKGPTPPTSRPSATHAPRRSGAERCHPPGPRRPPPEPNVGPRARPPARPAGARGPSGGRTADGGPGRADEPEAPTLDPRPSVRPPRPRAKTLGVGEPQGSRKAPHAVGGPGAMVRRAKPGSRTLCESQTTAPLTPPPAAQGRRPQGLERVRAPLGVRPRSRAPSIERRRHLNAPRSLHLRNPRL